MLYCVKDLNSVFTLTRGKTYEFAPGDRFHYDNEAGFYIYLPIERIKCVFSADKDA